MTIHLAVKEGELKVVKEMILQGTYVDHENLNHDTLLHYACLYTRPEIVSFLLSQGADTEKKNNEGKMPIQLAGYKNDFDSVKLLIENGAIFAEFDKNYETLLSYAIDYSNTKMIIYLIKKFEEKGTNIVNNSFLFSVGEKGSWELLEFLHINYGAFTYKNKEINQLFKNALILKNSPVLNHIIRHAYVFGNGSCILEKIYLFILSASQYITGWTYDYKNKLNAKDKLFLLAATDTYDNEEIIKFYLDNGVNINAKNSLGQNALHIAMQEDSPLEEIIKLLIEKGCELNIKDRKGNTPMYYYKRSLENTKTLFDDDLGHRSIANFIIESNRGFIQYLFDKGTNPKLNNSTFIDKS